MCKIMQNIWRYAKCANICKRKQKNALMCLRIQNIICISRVGFHLLMSTRIQSNTGLLDFKLPNVFARWYILSRKTFYPNCLFSPQILFSLLLNLSFWHWKQASFHWHLQQPSFHIFSFPALIFVLLFLHLICLSRLFDKIIILSLFPAQTTMASARLCGPWRWSTLTGFP